MEKLDDEDTLVRDREQTFEGFVRFWVYVFGAAILILIFLALFNS
jgi:hypothetical protein